MSEATSNTTGRPSVALEGQNHILELIATGAPLADVLSAIVSVMGQELPGAPSSILLMDPDGVHLRLGASAPEIESIAHACDGLAIGPAVGSCGTAVFRQKTVFVRDIATDPLWADYRQLALPLGMRACWSVPILAGGRGAPEGTVLGTFAVYARDPVALDNHPDLISKAQQLARIAIEANLVARQMRESEAKFRAYVDHASDALFIQAPNCIIRDVNRAACSTLGYTREELIGQHPRRTFDVDMTDEHERDITARLAKGETVTVDTWHVRKDGTRFPVEIRICTIASTGDRLAVTRDMTERVRAETALRETAEALRRAQALARIGSWRYDLTTGLWRSGTSAAFRPAHARPKNCFRSCTPTTASR
jgi:two-component system, cell cycle sensor histidine kinase and response regulator CckA